MLTMRLSILALLLATALPSAVRPVSAQQQTGSPQDSSSAATDIAKGTIDGKFAATRTGTGGWFAGGLASGFVGGLIGTGVITAVGASSGVNLPADQRLVIANRSETYQRTFEMSFGDEVKNKRKWSALKGGLLGTAILVTAIVSLQASQQ
jgi:predicted lipid-binding transport protein (Tim44 family)